LEWDEKGLGLCFRN